jgi:hydrogenase nickel incorporation protein HypB
LINKVDLLAGGLVDFDIERAKVDARVLNKDIKIFPISAKTGEGFAQWCDWLVDSVREL